MSDLHSMLHGNIPAVSSLDIQRFWALQSQHPEGSVSYSARAILQVCESESADPIAVGARMMLLGILLQQGVLENWRESDGFSKVVFDAAAEFPLPTGLQGLNPDEFVAVLAGHP
jgi:preprotein translocase subunit Sec63